MKFILFFCDDCGDAVADNDCFECLECGKIVCSECIILCYGICYECKEKQENYENKN